MGDKEPRHAIHPAGNIFGQDKNSDETIRGYLKFFSFDGYFVSSIALLGYGFYSLWAKKIFNIFWLMEKNWSNHREPLVVFQESDPSGFSFSAVVFLGVGLLLFLNFLGSYAGYQEKLARQKVRDDDAASK
ncbi:MAG: hypothetical protein NUV91_08620 [Candidatus Omnitrophica bacterium]|nr:hypothetical protein [Candidatus Omnitrophota bacterium]